MDIFGQFSGFALAALAALLCGALLMRVRQPPVAGYVLAGIILGPGALGAVANGASMGLVAEIAIALLLFTIAAQLSLRAFLATWKTAIATVALQTMVSLAVMLACSWLLGLSLTVAILLGLAAALSSAAVATMMLRHLGAARGRVVRITTAILTAQALAFLPMLLMVGSPGVEAIGPELIGKMVIAAALLAMLVKLLSRPTALNLPVIRSLTDKTDLAPLTALAYCLAGAALFGYLGLSAAFGAFLAGLVIGRSRQRKRMMAPFRPLQNILIMGAFLSIGMLTDLGFIVDNAGSVLLLVAVSGLVKAATNVAILRVLGRSRREAAIAGLSLSQPGEYSVILAGAALTAGAIGPSDLTLVMAVIGLGLLAGPLWQAAARRVHGLADSDELSLGELSAAAFGDDMTILRQNFDMLRHGEFRAMAEDMRVRRQLRSAPMPANDDEDPPPAEDIEPELQPEHEPEDTAETIAAIGAGVRAAFRDVGPDVGRDDRPDDRRENSNS
jgi:monovalent cation:H+ antiporter-2, CPA2 family